MNRTLRTLIVYGVSIILLAVMATMIFDQSSSPDSIQLSEFIDNVESESYSSVLILERSNEVQGSSDANAVENDTWEEVASYPDGYEGELTTIINESGTPSWNTKRS